MEDLIMTAFTAICVAAALIYVKACARIRKDRNRA